MVSYSTHWSLCPAIQHSEIFYFLQKPLAPQQGNTALDFSHLCEQRSVMSVRNRMTMAVKSCQNCRSLGISNTWKKGSTSALSACFWKSLHFCQAYLQISSCMEGYLPLDSPWRYNSYRETFFWSFKEVSNNEALTISFDLYFFAHHIRTTLLPKN